MNDKEYITFVKDDQNKPLNEIEPEELRTKIINAFATINSTIRKGKREYNEMYISNPKPPMGVFAYAEDYNEKIDNPVEFLNRAETGVHESRPVKERTEFLRAYALEHNVPFIVFGD